MPITKEGLRDQVFGRLDQQDATLRSLFTQLGLHIPIFFQLRDPQIRRAGYVAGSSGAGAKGCCR